MGRGVGHDRGVEPSLAPRREGAACSSAPRANKERQFVAVTIAHRHGVTTADTTPSTTSARTRGWLTVAFIAVCAGLYLLLQQAPQTLLVFAGAFNGMILPVGFAVLLFVAWRRRDLMNGYRYPVWLLVVGVLAWLVSVYIAVNAFKPMVALFSGA